MEVGEVEAGEVGLAGLLFRARLVVSQWQLLVRGSLRIGQTVVLCSRRHRRRVGRWGWTSLRGAVVERDLIGPVVFVTSDVDMLSCRCRARQRPVS